MNEKLKAARLKKGLSQEDVAALAGVSARAYQRWESGEACPNFESRRLLRQVFDCTDEDLGFGNRERVILFSHEELAAFADYLGLGGNVMIRFDEGKRNTLRKLLALAGTTLGAQILAKPEPWEWLATSSLSSPISSETLAYFENMIGNVWGLSNSGELTIAEQALSTFLPKLLMQAPRQPDAARLAAQGLRLQSVLAAHNLQLQEKVMLCEQAVEYAKLSGEGNALVSSLTELAVAYKYTDQPEQSLLTYQEALGYVDHASSQLVQSRVYAASASAFAKAGRQREARFYIDLAHETFPSQPDRDPLAALADYGKYLLIFYHGTIYLDLQEYEQAWNIFDGVHQLISVPERNRLEIRNNQSRAATLMQDLERYAACLEDSLHGSIAIKRRKRYVEAIKIFQEDMPQTWLKEDPIKHLVEQYHLDGRV